MKVLLLFSTGELGGAERSLSRMAMLNNNIHFQFGTLGSHGSWCEWIKNLGINPLIFGTYGLNKHISFFNAVRKLVIYIRNNPVNIVYVCGLKASFIIRLVKFLIPGTKLIHGIRWNPDSHSSLDLALKYCERTTGFLIDGWITNSVIAKKTLVSKCDLPSSNIHVIYNGVNFPENIFDYSKRPMEVLTIANVNPRKGYLEYLQVIKNVIKVLPQVKFNLIGRDDMNGVLQEEIVKQGLNEYINFLDFQNDVSPWLNTARVFVLPSLWNEGCPSSILEAMSFGVPCVAFEIDGIPELFDNSIHGSICKLKDYTSMSESIINILCNEKLAIQKSISCRRHIYDNFMLNKTVEKHCQILNLYGDL